MDTVKTKNNYENMVNITCTKHSTWDSIFYIQYCGHVGYRAVKFFNDTLEVRVGSYHSTPSEAYSEAICYM